MADSRRRAILKIAFEDPALGLAPQTADRLVDRVMFELEETPGIEVSETGAGGLLKEFQLGRFPRVSPLDQAQALSQDFARILIPARGDEVGYDLLVMVR